MIAPILVAHQLEKAYGERKAVRGVSLSIAKGEIFGLLGPNGAGKTTTISMLTGQVRPDAGQVVLDDLALDDHERLVKQRVGVVPQELALYNELSAAENLAFYGRIYGLSGRRLRERIAAVLELVGMQDRANDKVGSFSGGMQRRVNIAAGLIHEPLVLVLDEPTVGVDPQSRNAIFEGIERLNRAGLTILYTTHYMEEAQRLCHRVAIMDEGRIIALNTPGALIRSTAGGLIRARLAEAEAAAQIHKLVAALPAVQRVTLREDTLELEPQLAHQAVIELLQLTGDKGVKLSALEIYEPNLETVFLQLTGKQLRDNG